MMIRYEQGDMFATPADIRVNTVNCVGVMGAGLARAFKDKYPAMFKEYAKACKAGQVRPGKPHVWEKREFGDTVTVVNLPTKDHWRHPSEYEFIEKDLRWLREFLEKRGKVRIVVPALGCGHGGLDWDRVRPMMEQALDGLEAEVLIFGPSSSHEAGQRVDEQAIAQLESLGILRLRPGDPRYPEGLRGKSDATIHVKGDPGVLKGPLVAVVPSIKPTEREIQGLVACVKEIARPSVHILAGYSPQADRAVVRTALEQGAHVVICLVEGILEFKVRKDLQDVWDEERVTVISAAKPTEKWFPGGVGKATAIKLALSKAALVSDPDPEWLRSFSRNGAESVRSHLFYLFYGSMRDDTAALLRQLHAKAIGRNKETRKPNVADLLALVELGTPEVKAMPVAVVAEEREVHKAVEATGDPAKAGAGTVFPKRLIEVDLPIRLISAHARRENGVRHGHFKTLHMWWARRPLAACRAVTCAALWPDPADENCPATFRERAAELMLGWSREHLGLHSAENAPLFRSIRDLASGAMLAKRPELLRSALLAFLADLADWERSTQTDYLATARSLVQVAHEALGGASGTHPRVFDPFAGGGSIPLEALRLGCDAFASDLNPVAVWLNRMALEQIPRYGLRLADAVREAGERIKAKAAVELEKYYPHDADGSTPIAYIWARTVLSEGPDAMGDGIPVEIPLIREFWLAKKKGRSQALRWCRDAKGNVNTEVVTLTYADGMTRKVRRPLLEIFQPKTASELPSPTVQRGSATCPVTGHTTPVARIREQFKTRHGGSDDARLLAVATLHPARGGRRYRLGTAGDEKVLVEARYEAARLRTQQADGVSVVPDEKISFNELRRISVPLYGMMCWGDLFTSRQIVALTTFRRLIVEESGRFSETESPDFAQAVRTALAFSLSKQADLASSLCPWEPSAECPRHLFSRQAVPFVWDFAEGIASGDSSGSWSICVSRMADTIGSAVFSTVSEGQAVRCSATSHWLPDDSAELFFTDPPYYDAVPYAYLSDFFYVWLRRCLAGTDPELLKLAVVPKDEEIVVDRPHELSDSQKDIAFYERELCRAFAEARRVLAPDGIGTIVFASKTTASWEAILKAVIDAGWIVTASWPIDTEMETRVSAQGQARLASSVHLVCRPRESADGRPIERTGDWRDVMAELPKRIGVWLPRLSAEGVVGADAIFACIGPALEIFSRYSAVEKTSGERVELREYLEQVWAEVARQALNMIFEGADATGFEEDARLTAMWLWTLRTGSGGDGGTTEDAESDEDDEVTSKKGKAADGYLLEYDAARKIAQGLGCHLENLKYLVEVGGETATLLSVGARGRHLFGREDLDVPKKRGKKKGSEQGDLFAAMALPTDAEIEREKAEIERPTVGKTVLDQLHQCMILFGASRGQALKRFLVDDGVGGNAQFWKLAQALSALYPTTSNEKRWVDGVLARKKGLGF